MTGTSTVRMQRWKWTSTAGGRIPKNGGYQDGGNFIAERICGMASYLHAYQGLGLDHGEVWLFNNFSLSYTISVGDVNEHGNWSVSLRAAKFLKTRFIEETWNQKISEIWNYVYSWKKDSLLFRELGFPNALLGDPNIWTKLRGKYRI